MALAITSLGTGLANTNADNVSVTGATAAIGDLVVVVAERHFYDEGTTFSDSAGNTYTVDADFAHSSPGGYAIGRSVLTNTLTGGTITATFAGGAFAFGRGIVALKITGAATSSVLDQVLEAGHAGGANTSVSVGPTSTLSQADEIAIGVATGFDGATFTPGAGWTEIAEITFATGVIVLQVAYQIVTATTALTYTATASANTAWCAGIATYKADAGGGDPDPPEPDCYVMTAGGLEPSASRRMTAGGLFPPIS